MLKKIGFFVLLAFSLIPLQNSFAQTDNVGIIPSNIWYSKDPFEEGDKIKIYTVVYNPDSRELSGTVVFFDNKIFLGKNNFVVPGKSVRDVSIDWEVNVGDHVIFAKIENAKFKTAEGKYEEIYVAENTTEESKRKVSFKISTGDSVEDTDTSSDIGNMISENTPPFIIKAIDTTTDALENIREQGSDYTEENIVKTKKELNILEQTKKEESSVSTEEINKLVEKNGNNNLLDRIEKEEVKERVVNKVEEPLKYLKLFFLNILSFIFNHKIAFYSLLILIVFFILRFIWRLIF